MKGHCTVHVNHLHVATLNELDIFGEGVIVNHGDRSTLRVATVTAAENIEVLVLSGTELSRLIETQVLDAETIQELKELALKRKDQNEEKAATELLANGVGGGAAATTSKQQHKHSTRGKPSTRGKHSRPPPPPPPPRKKTNATIAHDDESESQTVKN
jgi:hypothetical protein